MTEEKVTIKKLAEKLDKIEESLEPKVYELSGEPGTGNTGYN